MATYPNTIATSYDSDAIAVQSNRVLQTGSGKVKVVRTSQQTHDITMVHPLIPATDVSTIKAFYTAEIDNEVTVEHPNGTDYTAVFTSEPVYKRHNATYWTVTSRLRGVEV